MDTVQKLIKSVELSNEERRTSDNKHWNELQFQSGNESLFDLQNQPCTPVPLSVSSLTNTPVVLKTASIPLSGQPKRSTSRHKETSSSKRTGLMDPATFKLVLEHQKEYSIQDKTSRSCDSITIARKKQWNTFWTSTTKLARKKKKNCEVCMGKKRQQHLKKLKLISWIKFMTYTHQCHIEILPNMLGTNKQINVLIYLNIHVKRI